MIETKIQILEQEVEELKTENFQLQERCQHIEEEYERLLQLIKVGARNQYGSKSEKYIDSTHEQLSLLDTAEIAIVEYSAENDTETITYIRRKKRRKTETKHLPRREVIIRVEEKDRQCACGQKKETIGYETKEKIHYQPAIFEMLVEKQEIAACPKGCPGEVVTAQGPKQALPKVKASEELLSHIAISKIIDRQPLYHLEKQFEQRYQVIIPRQTLARWMIGMGRVFQPLVNLMKEVLLSYDIGAMDATTLQVLKEPGRAAQRKSYVYCMRGGPPDKPVIVYEYNAKEHKAFLHDYFLDYAGTLQVDADPFFEDLPKEGKIKLSYCNAHARRKFEQVVKTARNPGVAKQAMRYYQQIYKVEKESRHLGLSSEDRLKLRQEKTGTVMEEFKYWLEKQHPKVLPKSPIGQAVQYCLKHWEGLTLFLMDGRLEVDNNLTEQQIKPFVIGRKNFLFSDTVAGADALAIHYSLMLTARQYKLDPYRYYVQVLKLIPYCQTVQDFEDLLPWNIRLEVTPRL